MRLNALSDKIQEIFKKYKLKGNATREQLLEIYNQIQNDMPQIKESFSKIFDLTFSLDVFFEYAKGMVKQEAPDVKLDKSFGKLNKEKLKGQKDLQEKITNALIKHQINENIIASSLPTLKKKGSERSVEAILLGLGPKDPNELMEFTEIIFHENNEDIEPLTGKKYGELKKQYIFNGLEKAKSFYEDYSKFGKDTNHTDVLIENMEMFLFLAEVDGTKIEDALGNLGLPISENPDLKKAMEDFKPYKRMLNGLGMYSSRGLLDANKLTCYASLEDLSVATEIVVERGMYDEFSDINSLAGQLNGNLYMYDFKKYRDFKKSDGNKDYSFNNLKDMTSETLQLLSIKYDVDVNKLQFFNDGKKLEGADPLKVTELLADGKTVTVKDGNGRFLLNYESSLLDMMKITGADYKMDVVKVAKDAIEEGKKEKLTVGDYKKDKDKAIKELKDNIKNQKERITGKTDEAIENQINKKVDEMLKSLPKLNKGESSYYSDIVNSLNDIKNKDAEKNRNKMDANSISYHNNKDLYIGGLKSLRTICQAYIDEKVDTQLSKEDKKRFNAVNKIYTSLLGIETDLQYVNKLEDNLDLDLAIKAKADNLEYKKFLEKEVKPVFDKDPTAVEGNKVSPKVEATKEVELNKQMNNNKN